MRFEIGTPTAEQIDEWWKEADKNGVVRAIGYTDGRGWEYVYEGRKFYANLVPPLGSTDVVYYRSGLGG